MWHSGIWIEFPFTMETAMYCSRVPVVPALWQDPREQTGLQCSHIPIVKTTQQRNWGEGRKQHAPKEIAQPEGRGWGSFRKVGVLKLSKELTRRVLHTGGYFRAEWLPMFLQDGVGSGEFQAEEKQGWNTYLGQSVVGHQRILVRM